MKVAESSMNENYEKRLGHFIVNGERCTKSPRSLRNDACADRFIPYRASAEWRKKFSMLPDAARTKENTNAAKEGAYSCLLKNELLGTSFEDLKDKSEEHDNCSNKNSRTLSVFNYGRQAQSIVNEVSSPYSLSPVSSKSQNLLKSPRKTTPKISNTPFKVLDAPELKDDFYLNLIDWSSTNIVGVGLGSSVYLWSACTAQVTRLCDLSGNDDSVTSLSWSKNRNTVAIGTHKGFVQLWDVAGCKHISTFEGHTARVGALAWNTDILSSGSRDHQIFQRDTRISSSVSDRKLVGHRQEVCGLQWSPDGQHLASGGNDNKLFIWSLGSDAPVQKYTEHLAAVKAIAWSPHQHGLLASGSGTADRCIRFWNTLTAQPVQWIDTGSQVCNLAWSRYSSELVSTHGYSQNQIIVWKYPSLSKIANLTGHSSRVLYLAVSPDGESIVTGAGDETLRFWNVFHKSRSSKETKSSLNLFASIR